MRSSPASPPTGAGRGVARSTSAAARAGSAALRPQADRCEFHGCDIDEPAIAWATEHLSPPFRLFLSREVPPLERPNASFDLIWATSVFTHLVHETWSRWMIELHRLLRPGGILMASYLGQRQSWILGEPWDDRRVGMNVINAGLDWDWGGPFVFHSEWWLRAHWGRAFEIVSIEEEALDQQGLVVMRRRDVTLTSEDLDRTEPDEPRELSAAIHQGRQLYAEAADQRRIARDLTRRLGEVARPPDTTLGELEGCAKATGRTQARARQGYAEPELAG